jgi:exonuclease SbcD
MRLLHTSDWHLGACLEQVSREADHAQFLDWLVETVETGSVELLLVAGDVFDSPTPSADAQALYYRFLHRLRGTGIRQVVVVGGNHDSPARLDAPKELLAAFGVHVVGGIGGPDDLQRCLCPVPGADGAVAAVVAAVPFVHEWRLGFRPGEGDDAARLAQLGAPFQRLYAELAERAAARWPGVPLVATGHLAVLGSAKDDAPQEIHLIGSLGGLPAGIFDPRFAYVALGHIHRGYAVGGTRAWYCGSPVALNFKEGRSPRRVFRVDLAPGGEVAVLPLEVPGTRQVLEFKGPLDAVQAALAGLAWSESLPPMVKVEVLVAAPRPGVEELVRAFVERLEPRPVLVQVQQTRALAADPGGAPAPAFARLEDLNPREVFRMLCAVRGEAHAELEDAFEQLLAQEDAR